MEQDFATGGNDDIFGNDLESNIAVVKKIVERLDNSLSAVSERNAEFAADEKTFYTALLNNLAWFGAGKERLRKADRRICKETGYDKF